jgi:peptidyl-tRNA hydrolase
MADDPLRMFLVVRRGAFDSVAEGGPLAGAAAVRCVREFAGDPDLEAWRPRPGKVTLRARTGGQWAQVLAELPHVVVGDAVAAVPPRRRSQRGPVLERLQAMSTSLEGPPARAEPAPGELTYLLNPRLQMSSGKSLAQIAHAAVMAADTGALEGWVAAGCPAQVGAPEQDAFDRLCDSAALVARVVDSGLTEVPPGTVTVLALPPGGDL